MTWRDFRLHKRLEINPSVIEGIYHLIAQIDGVKNSWQLTK